MLFWYHEIKTSPSSANSMHKNFLIITSMFVFEEPTTEMAKLDLLCFLFFEDFLKAITDISDIELNLFFN